MIEYKSSNMKHSCTVISKVFLKYKIYTIKLFPTCLHSSTRYMGHFAKVTCKVVKIFTH